MATKPQILWVRQDLRLADNLALTAAAKGGPVVPVFVLDDDAAGAWATGGAQRWWLHHSLSELEAAYARHGVIFIYRRGDAVRTLVELVQDLGAQAIHANRHFEPHARRQEMAINCRLNKADGECVLHLHDGSGLSIPGDVRSGSGTPYKVFTPFWKALRTQMPPPKPLPVPGTMSGAIGVETEAMADWILLPTKPDWAGGLRETWTPGEAGGQARLDALSPEKITAYKSARDIPSEDGTSGLSPHLHFGEVTARQVWHHAANIAEFAQAEPLLRQLGWRDFSVNLLVEAPHLPEESWSPKFKDFPWREDSDALARWQRGQTGYPIVDAGMRQLYKTGWMHNRVRMIVASFLCKHLLIHWRHGEDWFWDTLVDADLANNAAGWQWVAGSGADASPYFRIFNPITQSEKFDKSGAYIRRYVPELRELPAKYLHAPWEAPQLILAGAGVTLGKTYPKPMVDHSAARARALSAYETIKAA